MCGPLLQVDASTICAPRRRRATMSGGAVQDVVAHVMRARSSRGCEHEPARPRGLAAGPALASLHLHAVGDVTVFLHPKQHNPTPHEAGALRRAGSAEERGAIEQRAVAPRVSSLAFRPRHRSRTAGRHRSPAWVVVSHRHHHRRSCAGARGGPEVGHRHATDAQNPTDRAHHARAVVNRGREHADGDAVTPGGAALDAA